MKKPIIKILTISDIHGFHNHINYLPEADIIICCGDYTSVGSIPEVSSFLHWFSNLEQFEHKCLINGNHEVGFERNSALYKQLIPENVIYLENESVTIDGLKIYGSPFTKAFFDWAYFYYNDEEAKNLWDMIPEDTDILVTHQPIYGIRDEVESLHGGETDYHQGCKVLLDRVKQVKPLLHVWGHFHSNKNYGATLIDATMYANSAICDEAYIPSKKPLLFEVDKILRTIEVK